jgi:hypothetical protein
VADLKISQLTALTAIDAVAADVLPVVDTSTTTTKKIGLGDIAEYISASSAITTLLDGKVALSTVDAKGDLLVGSADNTVARLGVGSNDQILVADSSTGTGLKWATPASTTPVWEDDQNILANIIFG